MADRELRRKILERDGWKIQKVGPSWFTLTHPSGRLVAEGEDDAGLIERCAPAVESDPAQFWPWFLKWRDDNNANATLHIGGRHGGYCMEVRLMDIPGVSERVFKGTGRTPEEAGCRAVLSATEGQERK